MKKTKTKTETQEKKLSRETDSGCRVVRVESENFQFECPHANLIDNEG